MGSLLGVEQAEQERLNAKLRCALIACVEGDRDALGRIYRFTAGKFLAIVISMVGDNDMAADIVVQTYLSIWRSASSFDPVRSRAFTWMLVILRDQAATSRKRDEGCGTFELDGSELDGRIGDGTPTPDSDASIERASLNP